MRRTAFMLALAFTVGIVVGMAGHHGLNAQPAPFTRVDVLKTDIAGLEGKELIVQMVEFAPRGASGKHWHPGQEAFYVLEGSGIFEMEGHPPMTVKAGDAAYGPAKIVHEGKNASTTEPFKVVAFRIHPKGEPIAVTVTEPYFQQ
jgi:quercetin dioxygenase-like cupin family protein